MEIGDHNTNTLQMFSIFNFCYFHMEWRQNAFLNITSDYIIFHQVHESLFCEVRMNCALLIVLMDTVIKLELLDKCNKFRSVLNLYCCTLLHLFIIDVSQLFTKSYIGTVVHKP